jgi:hypothetical protein
VRHKIKWEQPNYGVNNLRAYVICCSCGQWIEAKTKADALTLWNEHRKSDR